jgi:hypothetical protein
MLLRGEDEEKPMFKIAGWMVVWREERGWRRRKRRG